MNVDRITDRLQRFEARCRRQGVPLTVQRREILKTVLERDDDPSADQIYDSVKDRLAGLSRTTVYRVLETLVESGVIRRLHHPGTSLRFDDREAFPCARALRSRAAELSGGASGDASCQGGASGAGFRNRLR